jgi:hypothetical protein
MTERTNRRRAPEHFSTSIRKVEPVGGDVVRLYFALERNGARDDVFTVLMPSASIPDALGNPCWQVKKMVHRYRSSVPFWADASAIGCSDYCLRDFPLAVASRVAI